MLAIIILVDVLMTFVALLGSSWDNMGHDSWRNTVFTWGLALLCVTVTWLLVELIRIATAQGTITPWKRIGKFALGTWAVAIALYLVGLLGIPAISPTLYSVSLSLVPSMVALPIWALVASVRTRGADSAHIVGQRRAQVPWEPGVKFTPAPGATVPPASRDVTPQRLAESWIIARSLHWKRALMLIVASGLFLAGLWMVNQWIRAQEMNTILTTIEQSESDMIAFNDNWHHVSESYQTWLTQEGSASANARVLNSVRASGRDLATSLKTRRSAWQDVSVLPWHGDISKLRDAYTVHLEDWVTAGEYFETVADFETAAAPFPNSSDIRSSFMVAAEAGRAIAIPLFGNNVESRIERIFRE